MFKFNLTIFLIVFFSSGAGAQSADEPASVTESSSYEGFFLHTSLGHGELAHDSFTETPTLATLGLGLGYDYYFLSNIGLGFSSKASYNHQVISGEKVGGTYTGLSLNPINARLVFSFFNIGLALEYHSTPSYQVSKATLAGDKILWLDGPGYSVSVNFPWKVFNGNFGITYHTQEFTKQEIGDIESEIEDLKLNQILFHIEFRDLFQSSSPTQ